MVLIYASDMLGYQNRLLMVLFDDAHFWLKMRMKVNVVAKTNMGSTSTPRPNQRHQQVPRAYRRSTISFFSGQQALHRLAVRNFCFKCIELWHALAWALASYGTTSFVLCGPLRALAKGHNGFLWSCKVLVCILEAYLRYGTGRARACHSSCQSVPELNAFKTKVSYSKSM